MRSRLCLVLAVAALVLPGCTPATVTAPPLSPGLTIREIAPLATESPLAVSRDGARVALVDRQGVRIRALASGAETRLTTELPTALTFSPAGDRLVAAFDRTEGSELLIFATDQIPPAARTGFAGKTRSLLWTESGILALTDQLQHYKFGSNLQNFLHQWDMANPPRSEKIHDVTLDPISLKTWGWEISHLPLPQLSPWGDEILFPRLIDPPAFNPYLKLIIRNLASGAERELATALSLAAGGAAYLSGGDEVVYWSEKGAQRIALWTGNAPSPYATQGKTIAASPTGALLWLDDKILQQGREIAQLPPQARPAAWLPDGRLFIRWQERLWLISGLPADHPAPPLDPPVRERLLRLRKWRAQGLISPQDYREQAKE